MSYNINLNDNGNIGSNVPDYKENNNSEELHQGNEVSSDDIAFENSNKYVQSLYEKVKQSNISEDDLQRELENILVYSLLYTDMSDEDWQELFGNLQSTISPYVNAVQYYYPLAAYVHLNRCSLKHEYDDIDNNIYCDDIMAKVKKIQQDWDYLSYISCMIYDSEDNDVITSFERLCNRSTDIIEALSELKTLYEYSQVPRCISIEELTSNFHCLQQTVTEYENIFEVYRKLAIFMHLLDCDYEHYIDDCGIHICKKLEKTNEE